MMSSKMQIQNFNQKIIDEKVEVNIVDFVKLLNHEIYHIDITFIDDFLLLIDNIDEFCIHHELLYKHGVLSSYNTNDVSMASQKMKVIRLITEQSAVEKIFIISLQMHSNIA